MVAISGVVWPFIIGRLCIILYCTTILALGGLVLPILIGLGLGYCRRGLVVVPLHLQCAQASPGCALARLRLLRVLARLESTFGQYGAPLQRRNANDVGQSTANAYEASHGRGFYFGGETDGWDGGWRA